mmetsp:Transcript_31363/g.75858  ORF Transcript_31363/g.75858 Transcript_31363/m.75858 type:complete len:778 (-) Transcript_31363:147-2480(-)
MRVRHGSQVSLLALVILAVGTFLVNSTLRLGTDFRSSKYALTCSVAVIVGTRPEVIKVAPVVKRLIERGTSVCIVNTNQQHVMVTSALKRFQLDSVDMSLISGNIYAEGPAAIAGHIMLSLNKFMHQVSPQVVVVQGDTTTAMVGSIAAFYNNITVAHVEAGLRTYDFQNPFPEEFHRRVVAVPSLLNFAPTPRARRALLAENIPSSRIWLSGNTVVDALFDSLSKPIPAAATALLQRIAGVHPKGRLVLVTMHRRESFEAHMEDMCDGVLDLLTQVPDAVVLLPVHTNPRVQATVKHKFGEGQKRLIICDPLEADIFPFILKEATLILTDSGGVQEEAVSLGKALLVMRAATERPEGVEVGNAVVSGRSKEKIASLSVKILTDKAEFDRMSQTHYPYGYGNSSVLITDVILSHMKNGKPTSAPMSAGPHEGGGDKDPAEKQKSWSSHQDPAQRGPLHPAPHVPSLASLLPAPAASRGGQGGGADLVVVLTVFGRATLDLQMRMLQPQTAFKGRKTHVIIFQNGKHQNIDANATKWEERGIWGGSDVTVTFTHSTLETGYYGRFLAPLIVNSQPGAYWWIFDDDVIFGNRYLENCIRVVDSGSIAVRNGRFVGNKREVAPGMEAWHDNYQATWDDDIAYDFGGHIWAGRIEWLKLAWQNPPPTVAQSEDFWISAVLKAKANVGTKKPRCPKPPHPQADIENCACSMWAAMKRKYAIMGADVNVDNLRASTFVTIHDYYDFRPMPGIERKDHHDIHPPGPKQPFNLAGTFHEQCMWFT